MDNWKAVTALAQRQYGLIERSQAEKSGVSVRGLNQRAEREGWARPHLGVLALPGSIDSPERRILAAVLAVQGEAWATRWTAAYLWGLTDRLRVPVTLLVPHDHRAARLQGVQVVRTRRLGSGDTTVRHGVPTATSARLLADLALVEPRSVVRALAIDARQKGLLDLEALWELAQRFHASVRHRTIEVVARELLGQAERVDSELEWRLRALLRRADLPVPYPEPFPVEVDGRVIARIDVAWPQWKVGVECDGYRYHSERAQLDRDSRRQNRLLGLGWRLVRLTWRQVHEEPDEVVAVIHRILVDAGAVRAS